jgi:hypothetical protein
VRHVALQRFQRRRRRFQVDESKLQISFEYDASRLRETEVTHVLGHAGIPVLRRIN